MDEVKKKRWNTKYAQDEKGDFYRRVIFKRVRTYFLRAQIK